MPKNHTHNKTQRTNSFAATLSRLWFLFNRRDKIYFFLLILGMITAALIEVLSIGIIPAFMGLVMQPEKILEYSSCKFFNDIIGNIDARNLLLWGCIVLIIVFTIKTAFLFILYNFQVRFVQNRRLRLSRRLFSAYMNASYAFHLQHNSSELFRNIIQEVNPIVMNVVMPLLMLIMGGSIMTMIFVMLLLVNPFTALISILFLGAAGGGFLLLTKNRLNMLSQIAQEYRMRVVKSIRQGLGVIKELRILRREKNFIEDLDKNIYSLIKAERFQFVANKITSPYLEFVAVLSLLTVMLIMLLSGGQAQSLAPTLTLFAISFVKLKTCISQIVTNVNSIRVGMVSVSTIYFDLKLLEQSIKRLSLGSAAPDSLNHKRFSREIHVENISYRYPGCESFALKNINLCLTKGSCIALVGRTGSGKTTLVDVILGLLDPESGIIKTDGVDIHEDIVAWQTNIGYIPQFIYLTDDTIRRNIALGVDEAKIEEKKIREALRIAQLEEFVNELPDGLDTVVGERGAKLSGGQRQRIGIARALYHRPDLIIMDEATSALDNATEKAVIDAVNQLRGEKTIVMIAHRLSTIQNCDTLYFLDNGKIEMCGSYTELMNSHSGFRSMAQTN